jgi:uncharacterized protein YraI
MTARTARLALVALALCLTAAVAQAASYVIGDGVRVRAAPTAAAEEIDRLPMGSEVTVRGTQDDWSEVTYSYGRTGWIASDYVGDGAALNARLSDAEIRRMIIGRSQAGYSGSCPCPDNRDRAGRRCGARSAYSRPGGGRRRSVTSATSAPTRSPPIAPCSRATRISASFWLSCPDRSCAREPSAAPRSLVRPLDSSREKPITASPVRPRCAHADGLELIAEWNCIQFYLHI